MRRLFFILFILSVTMIFGCQGTIGTIDKAEKNVQGGFVQTVLNKMDEYTPETIGKENEKTPDKENAASASSSSTEDPKPFKKATPKTAPKPKYSVTIDTDPKDSVVRIMNIDSKYYSGITLPAGIYDVQVQREGYKSYREWINIEYDIILKVVLKKSAEAYRAKKASSKKKKLILPKSSSQKSTGKTASVKPQKTIVPVQKKELPKDAKIVAPGQPEKAAAEAKPQVISEEVLFPASLLEHSNSVSSLCFSPDGSVLASGAYDNMVIAWRVKDGSILHKFDHGDRVKSVAFSPDNQTIASAGSDKLIKLWDIKTGKLQSTLKGHKSRVYSVKFGPNGDIIVSGGNNELYIWDAQTGKTKYFIIGDGRLYPRFGPIHEIAFNPNGKDAQGFDLVFSCAQGIAFLNIDKKKTVIINDTAMPHSVTFSPDSKYIAWGARHQDNESEYYPRFALVDTKKIDHAMTSDNALASADRVFYTSYTPDGKGLIMLSYNQAVLYDLNSKAIVRRFTGTTESSVTDAALSPDGKILAVTSRNLVRLLKLNE